MLHDAQRTSAPSAFSVSISTAVWIVMWREPATRAHFSGCFAAYSARTAISDGIQDFARRPASEQARLRAQLEAVIAVTTAELDAAGRLVLEASDGAAIVLWRDPIGALRLTQRALTASAAGLPLSAGLNHGALQVTGRKGAEAMTGDGIAVAASIAEFAPPG